MNKYNQRLKALCKEKNIQQEELAEAIGITQSAISKYMNSQVPNFETGVKICRFLGISAENFFNNSRSVNDENQSYFSLKELKRTVEDLNEKDLHELKEEIEKRLATLNK